MDIEVVLALAFAIVVIVAVIVVESYRKQQRSKQMRALAGRLGYRYEEGQAGPFEELPFALFSQGIPESRRATDVLRTEADGAAATIFDYYYVAGTKKNRSASTQSVLILESDRLDLPPFALRPEGFGQKFQGLLGQQDIDFADQPGFSGAYVLQGPDEPAVRALFGGDKLAFFARQRGLSIEGAGRGLLYYRANKRVAPAGIPSFLEEGLAVLHLLAGDGAPPAT